VVDRQPYSDGVTIQDALAVLRAAADDGRLAALCRPHGVRLVMVFGSALDDPERAHDLDVAVSLEGQAPATLQVLDALVALTGVETIDLMVLDGASPTARRNGLVGALPLFEAEPGLFARTQMAAAIEFYETDWLRRLDLERMAST
jgi:predicted nucleotidyltransferase